MFDKVLNVPLVYQMNELYIDQGVFNSFRKIVLMWGVDNTNPAPTP